MTHQNLNIIAGLIDLSGGYGTTEIIKLLSPTLKPPQTKLNQLVMFETTFSNGKEITSYLATAYAEGFGEGEEASRIDQLKAWAYLIKSGIAYQLQGWFGRNASALIQSGIISTNGIINWNKV